VVKGREEVRCGGSEDEGEEGENMREDGIGGARIGVISARTSLKAMVTVRQPPRAVVRICEDRDVQQLTFDGYMR
jgi:hypothetical protein